MSYEGVWCNIPIGYEATSLRSEVRCVFYRHQLYAEKEKARREHEQAQLEEALKDFSTKLNKRKYVNLDHCQTKLERKNRYRKAWGIC